MAWAKIDDHLDDNDKFVGLSSAAAGQWLFALAYASRKRTDGFIPLARVKSQILGRGEDFDAITTELVSARLWIAVEGGFQINDYLEYNPSRADQEAKDEAVSAARSEAGKRGAESRWNGKQQPDECQTDSKPIANDMTNDKQTDGPVTRNPYPVTPFPVNPEPGTQTERGAKRATRPKERPTKLPDNWTPPPEMRIEAIEAGMTAAEYDREFTKFRNHFLSGTVTKVRWDLTWHNWLLRIPEMNRNHSPTRGNGNRRGPDFEAMVREMEAEEQRALG